LAPPPIAGFARPTGAQNPQLTSKCELLLALPKIRAIEFTLYNGLHPLRIVDLIKPEA
jgi:hypothetical protein